MKNFKTFVTAGVLIFGISATLTSHAQTGLNISSPSSAQNWGLGSTQTITWSPATNTTTYGQTAPTVNISLVPTNNSNNAAPYIIAQNIPNTGSYAWTVPSTLATTYQGPLTLNVGLSDSSAMGTQTFYIGNSASSTTSSTLPTLTQPNPTSGSTSTSTMTSIPFPGSGSFSNGALLLSINSPTVYLVNNGKLVPFTRPSIFFAYNYSWNQIQIVPDSQINNMVISSTPVLAPNGSLIRGESDPAVYLVTNGQKSGIPNRAVLNRLNLNLNKIIVLGDSELQNYPTIAPQQ